MTVFDKCETPIAANIWYAERQGISIETIAGDILKYQSENKYDAICSHSLFLWLSPEEQLKAIKKWYGLLRPGGKVLTSTRLFSGVSGTRQERTIQEEQDFLYRMRRAANIYYDDHRLDPDLIVQYRYEYMATARKRYIVNDSEFYQSLFENAGFQIDNIMLWDDSNESLGLPSPKKGSKGRLHIIASRK